MTMIPSLHMQLKWYINKLSGICPSLWCYAQSHKAGDWSGRRVAVYRWIIIHARPLPAAEWCWFLWLFPPHSRSLGTISMCSTWKCKHENGNMFYILLFLHWSAMSLLIYVACFAYGFVFLLLLKLVLSSFQDCILLMTNNWPLV